MILCFQEQRHFPVQNNHVRCFIKIQILGSNLGNSAPMSGQELGFNLKKNSGDSDTEHASWTTFFRKNGVDYKDPLNGLKQRNDMIAFFFRMCRQQEIDGRLQS